MSTGEIIGGLDQGAFNSGIYKDPDLSVKGRDTTKTEASYQELFREFDHGPAFGAGNGDGQRVGDLNKNKTSNPLHQEAVNFAYKRSMHEFDRFSYLIYERYGREGLRRFADYSIKPEMAPVYLDIYAKPVPSRYASPSSLMLQDFPASLAINADLGEEVQSARVDSDAELKHLFVFNYSKISSSNPYYFVDQSKIDLERIMV